MEVAPVARQVELALGLHDRLANPLPQLLQVLAAAGLDQLGQHTGDA